MFTAVEEINKESDNQPDNKPEVGYKGQDVNEGCTGNDANKGYIRHQWASKRPFNTQDECA